MGRNLVEQTLEASVFRDASWSGPRNGNFPTSLGHSDMWLFRPHLTPLHCPCALQPIPAHPGGRASPASAQLTDAHVLVVQLGGTVAVEAQTAVLAVLASRVVLAADAGHHVEEVNVAASVGVAVALAVWASRAWETQRVSEQRETVPACCPSPVHSGKQEQERKDPPKDTQV